MSNVYSIVEFHFMQNRDVYPVVNLTECWHSGVPEKSVECHVMQSMIADTTPQLFSEADSPLLAEQFVSIGSHNRITLCCMYVV